MELISVKLPSGSKVFRQPLVDLVHLFGFATNRAQAIERIEQGVIKVNEEPTTTAYRLRTGDLLTLESPESEYGIVFEEQP